MKPNPERAGHCILKFTARCSENTSEERFIKSPPISFRDISLKYQPWNLEKSFRNVWPCHFADEEIKVQEGVIDWLEEIRLDIMPPNSSSPGLFTRYHHTFWNMSVTKGTSLKLWPLMVLVLVQVQLQYLALCF